jgi:hypothetical protein
LFIERRICAAKMFLGHIFCSFLSIQNLFHASVAYTDYTGHPSNVKSILHLYSVEPLQAENKRVVIFAVLNIKGVMAI